MLDLFHRTYGAIFRRYPVLWRMALVVLLGEIVFAAINNYALSFYVVDDLGRPASLVGILVSTFLIAEMLLKLPFGHLSDRHGRRRFAMYGLAVCTVGPAMVCALPTHLLVASPILIYLVLMPLRVLDGAGAAALWPPLFAAVPDHVPTQERAAAMSVMNTAYMAGLALGPTLAGVAMTVARLAEAPEHWVGKAPFAMAAGVAALGALVASRLPAAASVAAPHNGRPKLAVGNLRLVAIVIIITMGEMFATSTIAPYLALYVREVTGIHRSNVGFLLLLLFVPAGVLGIPIGHLSDRWPRRRVVQAALITSAVGLWLVPVCDSLWELIAVGVVVVIGFLFGLPSWLALISELAPESGRGKTMGLMASAQGLGAFLGPLVGGRLWEINICYPWYAAAGALTLAAACSVLFISGGRQAGLGVTKNCYRERGKTG